MSFRFIYVIKSGVCVCVSVCGHFNVRLTSPPVLMLWGTQGYLGLPYDLMEVIKLFGVTFKQKKSIFSKNTLCHSFHISVIPSIVLSFLPDYCHSFQIIVIPSVLVSFLLNIVIPSELLPFHIFFILISSSILPYPKDEKIKCDLNFVLDPLWKFSV